MQIARLGQFLSFSSSLFLLQLRILPLASTVPRFLLFSISNSSSSWSWVLSTDNSDAQSCHALPCPTLLAPVSLLSVHSLILRLCPLQLALLLHPTSIILHSWPPYPALPKILFVLIDQYYPRCHFSARSTACEQSCQPPGLAPVDHTSTSTSTGHCRRNPARPGPSDFSCHGSNPHLIFQHRQH
jgi:hypothetical protein